MGFTHAAVGAMVRSSYHADQQAHAAGVAASRLTPADAGAPSHPARRASGRSPAATAAAPMRALALARPLRPQASRSTSAPAATWSGSTAPRSARLTGPALLELIGDDGRCARAAAPAAARSDARCPRCAGRAEDGAQPVALGPLAAARVPATARRLPVVRAVPGGEGADPADVAPRPGPLLRDRGRIDCVNCGAAIGRDDERCRYCDLGARACSTSPGWRARSIRRATIERARGAPRRRGAAAALQCAACGAALPPGETIELRAVRRDARDPEPARGQRRGRGARAGAAGARREAAAAGRQRAGSRRSTADLPRRREWVAGMEAEARRAPRPRRATAVRLVVADGGVARTRSARSRGVGVGDLAALRGASAR